MSLKIKNAGGNGVSSSGGSGAYVWSKQGMSESIATDSSGGSYTLCTSDDSRSSTEIEFGIGYDPVYDANSRQWKFPTVDGYNQGSVWTVVNTDNATADIDQLISLYDHIYIRLTAEPNVFYKVTSFNVGSVSDNNTYTKSISYDEKFTASIDTTAKKYVVGKNRDTYPDDNWMNGYHYKLIHESVSGEIGVNWNRATLNAMLSLTRPIYKNGIWFATKDGLKYSKDGKTWFQSNINTNIGPCAVEYGNNMWVATDGWHIYRSVDGMTWNTSSTTSGSTIRTNVCYVADRSLWVTSLTDQGLYYSADGLTWTQSNITSGKFYGMCYGNGITVAGTNSALYYSINGTSWTQVSGFSDFVNCIIYENSKFVLVGDNSVYYSTDGKTWNATTINVSSSNAPINNIAYGNNIWVTGGSNKGIYYSTDAISWTKSNMPDVSIKAIFYYNNLFVATSTGGTYYSIDGINWTQSNVSDNENYVYGANGIWISDEYFSLDGMTWIRRFADTQDFECASCHYANNMWIANIYGKGIAYSNDGINWKQSFNTTIGWASIDYFNNLWIASGAYYSADGINWTKTSKTGGSALLTNSDVHHNDKICVTAGNNSDGIFYSTDGMSWFQSNITDKWMRCPYYSNNIWVAGSNSNGLYYSTDGKTWTQSNITSGGFNCVYNANGLWVAGSNSGNGLYYSTDGKTWTQSNITSGYFDYIYNANDIWVTLTQTKGIMYSIDGKSWIQSNITSSPSPYNKNRLCYTGTRWLAFLNNDGVYYSTDGKVWVKSNIVVTQFLDIYYANCIAILCCSTKNGIYYSKIVPEELDF